MQLLTNNIPFMSLAHSILQQCVNELSKFEIKILSVTVTIDVSKASMAKSYKNQVGCEMPVT